MRLIDADNLLEETRRDRDYARKNGFLDMYYERQVLMDRIKAQPTAYSVDKVVEKLEERKALYERLVGYESKNGTSTEKNQHIKAIDTLNEAIEIVKAGGKNE